MSELAIVYDDVTITLGTLGSKTVIHGTSKIDSARTNGFRVMKGDYWMDYIGKTATEGPIVLGYNIGLSTAEVAEAIVDDPQSSTADKNAGETMRPVWPLELVPLTHATIGVGVSALKGTFNPKWSVPEGQSSNWFAFNMDGGALTTGMSVRIFCKWFGVWLRD